MIYKQYFYKQYTLQTILIVMIIHMKVIKHAGFFVFSFVTANVFKHFESRTVKMSTFFSPFFDQSSNGCQTSNL